MGGDTAKVLRKLSDSGWYYVERFHDGVRGWIPRVITREISSEHVKAKHLKQRHVFLKLVSNQITLSTSGAPSYALPPEPNNNNSLLKGLTSLDPSSSLRIYGTERKSKSKKSRSSITEALIN